MKILFFSFLTTLLDFYADPKYKKFKSFDSKFVIGFSQHIQNAHNK